MKDLSTRPVQQQTSSPSTTNPPTSPVPAAVTISPPSPPSIDPTAQFAILQGFVSNGILSAQELVQLAPSVFSGTDPSLVPSIQAILPLQNNQDDTFESAFNMILTQRGINRDATSSPTSSPVEVLTTSADDTVVATEVVEAEEVKAEVINDAPAAEQDEIKEVIVIAIDVSGSMECPFEVDDDVRTIDRTRLQAVKQCFYGFRDQTQQHKNGNQHLIGLLSFSDKIQIHTYPTSNLDVFEDVIDDMSSSGRTAIFEAISIACNQMLKPIGRQNPKADLRVLVLSDGLNNCNTISGNDALKSLADVGAVCDCMILGDKSNSADDGLRKLVAASEGQCVQFNGLADAYEALESPAMISLESRRNGDTGEDDDGNKVFFDREAFQMRMNKISKLDTVVAAPMKRGVIASNTLAASSAASRSVNTIISSYIPLTSVSMKTLLPSTSMNKAISTRIMKELKSLIENPIHNHAFYFYPGIDDKNGICSNMKVLMIGSKLYKDHAFELQISIPSDYPFKPPKLQVITPIYHYAISAQGHACLSTLHDSWSPAKTIKSVLSDYYDLVHNYKEFDPNCDYAQRSWLSDLLRTDPEAYHREAIQHSKDNALKIPPSTLAKNADQYTADELAGLLSS